jgi:hypothetical protein
MSRTDDNHSFRRIVLPSGRSIEVVRFADTTIEIRDLHICPACSSELVQPYDWTPDRADHWKLTLACPNCGWLETDVFTAAEIELLEEHLDAGVTDLITDLRRLTHTNMSDDIERFIHALHADLVLPEDF